MILLLLLVLLLAGPAGAQVDSELEQRFRLAAAPGLFRLSDGKPLPPSAIEGNPAWDVNWKSAPSQVTPLEFSGEGEVLLRSTDGHPLLIAQRGQVVVSFDTQGAIRRWPYFNYVLYRAASQARGETAQRFGDWPYSPVPHTGSRVLYVIGTAAGWTLFFFVFSVQKRRGVAFPDSGHQFFASINLKASHSRRSDREQLWNRTSFARPLAGFLTLLGTMGFLVGAYFIIQWVLSNRVQPFPEADGLWRTTWDTLIVVAALFEFGTNVASQKYFAEHRATDPQEALKDVQFYLWWAIFQRFMQATVLVGMAVGWLPYSEYAIYAPFVTLFGLKGMPALFQLGKLLCSGLQRFDYQNLLDLLEQRLLVFLMPIPFVLLGRAWGLSHPQFGEAFGAAVGLAVGHFASQVFMLFLGLYVLYRIGVPLHLLFLAQFDWPAARRQLVFGGKIAIGSEPVLLLKSVESVMIVKMMTDFTAWLGIHQLLTGRLFWLFVFAQAYYGGAMPAISQVYSAGKHRLTQYFVARYFQFGAVFQFTIFSMMMALGPAFISALGPQWERAIPFLLLSMLQGIISAPAWLSDSFQQGTGRPGTMMIVMLIEQGARLGLFLLLVPKLQFAGIFLATLGALAIKDVVGWIINHYFILPFRISVWAAIVAPAAAGLANYLLWAAVVAVGKPDTNFEVLVLMCVASAISFFFCFFVCGLAGGYDPVALEEFRMAAEMCTVAQFMARGMYWCAKTGAALSPFKPVPLSLTGDAYREAEELDSSL